VPTRIVVSDTGEPTTEHDDLLGVRSEGGFLDKLRKRERQGREEDRETGF
jgi:hypothetical protein